MEVLDRWVAEFFIRRQQNPRVSSAKLLLALKLGDSANCLKLKLSSVLRDISNFLVRGTIDEGMLDLLEILEHLLQLEENWVIMESHKSSYCWMAVECTLRFMWPLSASEGLFKDAIERIWTKRIGVLKQKRSDLVTDELLKWETDLKKALEDPELYQRIRETNIRYTAISFLTQFLKEQWELLGCSSLESLAQTSLLKRKARNVEDGSVDNRGDPNAVDERTRRLKSDEVDKVNEQHAVDEEQTLGAQEQEHEPRRELKNYLLKIQGHIDPSSRQKEEHNNGINHSVDVTPQPVRDNRIEAGSRDHNKAADNANEKSSYSQRTWSGRVQPRLNVSPLKKANSNVRRPKKFWTHEEVDALREGVKEYGKSWKDIKNANPAIFRERTEVDLKDKWRNLFGR